MPLVATAWKSPWNFEFAIYLRKEAFSPSVALPSAKRIRICTRKIYRVNRITNSVGRADTMTRRVFSTLLRRANFSDKFNVARGTLSNIKWVLERICRLTNNNCNNGRSYCINIFFNTTIFFHFFSFMISDMMTIIIMYIKLIIILNNIK